MSYRFYKMKSGLQRKNWSDDYNSQKIWKAIYDSKESVPQSSSSTFKKTVCWLVKKLAVYTKRLYFSNHYCEALFSIAISCKRKAMFPKGLAEQREANIQRIDSYQYSRNQKCSKMFPTDYFIFLYLNGRASTYHINVFSRIRFSQICQKQYEFLDAKIGCKFCKTTSCHKWTTTAVFLHNNSHEKLLLFVEIIDVCWWLLTPCVFLWWSAILLATLRSYLSLCTHLDAVTVRD